MPDQFNPGQESVAQTASPNIQTEQVRYDSNAGMNALMSALGTPSTQASLADFSAQADKAKLDSQAARIDGYRQQFQADGAPDGAVSQAQVKARFPELVPVIAARISESLGKEQGQRMFAPIVEHINNDDSLRLDSNARTAYITEQKAKLFASIPAGNEFYASGLASSMDQSIQQESLKWQGQTAAYHEDVQKKALSAEFATAIQQSDPTAAMAGVDSNWSQSSSLNPIQRNAVYVDTLIKTASATNNLAMLDRMPGVYLDTDSRDAIYKAGIRITDQRYADFKRAKEFDAYQRAAQTRSDQIEINTAIANGQAPDGTKYLGNPASHDYYVQALVAPVVAPAISAKAVSAFTDSVLGSSTTGSPGSLDDMTTAAAHAPNMNPLDRSKLIDLLPKLMEGHIALTDERVHSSYTNNIGSRLDMLGKSADAQVTAMLGRGNLVGNARSLYESEVRNGYTAAFHSSGNWPRGNDAQTIVDSAVAKTSAYIDKMTDIHSLERLSPTHSDVPTPHVPKPSPVLPSGVTKIN